MTLHALLPKHRRPAPNEAARCGYGSERATGGSAIR